MPLAAHTMPNNDEEVRAQVKAVFGFEPCLWQIQLVRAVPAGEDVITIACTGSGSPLHTGCQLFSSNMASSLL